MSLPEEAYRALETIVGTEYISADPVTCRAYNVKSYRAETAFKLICTLPECVILPKTTEEVQRIVKVCNRYKIPYTPVSTYWLGNSSPKRPNELLIDLKRMNKLEIDAKHMYAIVEPGVIYGQLQQEAMNHGLYTMVSGGGSQVSVICNHLNHGWSPLNYRTGLISRRPLGIEWVMPDGEVLRLGSLAINENDYFWGEGIGPDLRGILRGAKGWLGAMGIVTRMATKLIPFQPEKLEPTGISPDTTLALPQKRMRWYNFTMPSREALQKAMYELGRYEIAAAATKVPVLWRYIARAKSKEDFWEQWAKVTPEEVASTHILRILVIGYTSEKQLEYEERVLMDIMDRLGGKLRPTKPTDESWIKNADSAGMWWMSGAYMSVEYVIETIRHGVKQGEAIAELKKRFVPPLLDDYGDPGWFQVVELGHGDYSEFLIYWDPYDPERYKADQMYLETAKLNINKGFYTSFLNSQPLWLMGPAYGPNYHLWQIKVKKAFDRDNLSNPPGIECYDEIVERADWLTRDWEKGSMDEGV
ncbi:FAD-binding oxidoreductase [Chloroflexota bacterium]